LERNEWNVCGENEEEIGIGYLKIIDENDIRFLNVDIQIWMSSPRKALSGEGRGEERG